MRIRLVHEREVQELASIYYETVRQLAPQHYSPEQVNAWANSALNLDTFRTFIIQPTTYVAVDGTGIVGFAGIENNGHVTATYVRSDRTRQGIGSALMHQIFAYAAQHKIDRLYAEASEFSLGLFKKFGFRVYDTEHIVHNGVAFTRHLVERMIQAPIPTGSRH